MRTMCFRTTISATAALHQAKWSRCVTWPLFAAFLSSGLAFARAPERSLNDLYHKAWTVKDGAPAQIIALARTTDGLLWVGTPDGLYQFDGVSFERYRPMAGQTLVTFNINSLFATPDGGLWLAYGRGGVAFLKDGRIKNYLEQKDTPTSTDGFLRDRDGGMWKRDIADHLSYFDGTKWANVGADRNFSGKATNPLNIDNDGTIWVDQSDGLSCLPQGKRNFIKIAYKGVIPKSGVKSPFTPTTEWVRSFHGPYQPVCDASYPVRYQFTKWQVWGAREFEDLDGSSWIASLGGGVLRQKKWLISPEDNSTIPVRFPAESFTKKDGLTNDFVRTMIKDKEGNVWVGTNGGLDMFHPVPMGVVRFPADAQGFNLLPTADGALWVPMLLGDENFVRIVDGRVESMTKKIRPLESVIGSYIDPKGVIWMGTLPNGLLRLENDKIEKIDTFGGFAKPLTEDREGRLWVAISTKGAMRLEDGKWTITMRSLGGPPVAAGSGFTDTTGRIWIGSSDNTVKMLDGAKVTVFTKEQGISVGDVFTINGRDGRVWITGERGLEYFDGMRFRPVIPFDAPSFVGVREFLDTKSDGIWLAERRGLIQIPDTEVTSLRNDPNHHVKYRIFNYLDGLPGSLQVRPLPSMAEGADGILWFATTEGLAWIDPKSVPKETAVPTVLIRSVKGNKQDYDAPGAAALSLPAHTTALQINYTALSLAVPERVRFRYQLENVDHEWQDAGVRRQAFYTNLSPGKYRFRVIACNGDGLWNNAGAAIDFYILPAVYQTLWFRLFYFAAGVGGLWIVYLLRLKQVTGQLQERLGARLEERERIARELHDTLLQGVQGLVLRFHAVMKALPEREPARQMMDQVLDRADEVLLEGRQRVRDLRVEGATEQDLPNMLSDSAVELGQDYSIPFRLTVTGTPHVLDPTVNNEVYQIAREAVSNAFKHSRGTLIETQITYGQAILRVIVRDDGRGIEKEILGRGRAGHWGLPGMQERAQKIGGKINISSRSGEGTEIDLVVPARLAYRRSPKVSLWRRTKTAIIKLGGKWGS